MKDIHYLQILILVMLGFSCSCNRLEPVLDNPFHAELHEQMETGRFSPLAFARGDKILQPVEANMVLMDDRVVCLSGTDSMVVGLSPFTVTKYQAGSVTRTGYEVRLVFGDGSPGKMVNLENPLATAHSCLFSTNIEGLEVQLIPGGKYLEWSIENYNKLVADSIHLVIKTAGPFFGGGERFMSSRLDGRTVSNQPNDHFMAGNSLNYEPLKRYEPSYLQVPFYITPGGQGWYIDEASSLRISFDKEGNIMNAAMPGNRIRFFSITDEHPKKVLETYTGLIGRQPPLPEWAFGVWVNLLEGMESVYEKAGLLKKWDIPASAIWLFDLDDPATSTGWTNWSRGYYGNYRSLTDSLHNMGFKVLTYLLPFSDKDLFYYKFENPVYHRLDSLDLILKAKDFDHERYYNFRPEGQYDFYNPAIYGVWHDMLQEILMDDNFDGWMEDFGDICYAFDKVEENWDVLDFGLDYPLSVNEYANAYPLVYHKLTYLLASGIKKDFVGFCRSGSAGSAAYTKLVWGGDQWATWDKNIGYPSSVTAGISCGLSGYGQWAPDILCDSPSRELWKRWVQFAAFTPLMRDHLWENKKDAIDLWTDESTRDYYRNYACIHVELKPYLLETAREYQETGCPMIRHMFLEFPGDTETYNCEYQYMLGSEMIVAPVTEENATSKEVYLPEGEWIYFWTNESYQGKNWIKVKAPVNWIPLFIKKNTTSNNVKEFVSAARELKLSLKH